MTNAEAVLTIQFPFGRAEVPDISRLATFVSPNSSANSSRADVAPAISSAVSPLLAKNNVSATEDGVLLPEEILGETTLSARITSKPTKTPTPTHEAKLLGVSQSDFSSVFVVGGAILIIGCGILVFLKYRESGVQEEM